MKRDSILSINIGLENNPLRAEEVWEHVRYLALFDKGFVWKVEMSSYKGAEERTFVAEGFSSYKFSKVAEVIENLAVECKQECVAFKYNHNCNLLYNPTSKILVEDRLAFDEQIYVNLT